MKCGALAILVFSCAVCGCGGPVRASESGAKNDESHLMRHADVHGERIVFTYEGDLWLAPTQGGDAWRITNHPGVEEYARFSPDGSKLAFTASYDGGTDVYVMDARGGVPTRLTWHPAEDRVLDWFPDGEHVLFRSRREWPLRGERIYRVSIHGGMPEKLPVDRAGLTALSPDATQIAYNRISREDRTWKRHQGGTAQDIWMGSLATGDFRRITDWVGTDNYPMWQGEAIYFVSDRRAGTLNLYHYNTRDGQVRALTNYTDYDVKYPSIGPGLIVYQYAESLHLLDLKTGKTRKVALHIPTDLVAMRAEYKPVTADTGSFGLSPDGRRLLLESRGEIVSIPVEKDKGDPVNLTRNSATREKNAAFSPDEKWVAFLSDKSGEEEVYLVDAKGEGEWRQVTTGGKGFRQQLVWSPDSRHLLFHDKFMKLNLVNTETGEITIIDQGRYDDAWERWGIQDYVWSPCSRWVAYSKMEAGTTESVFLYSLDTNQSTRVTGEMTNDFSPSFDPGGKYLYFLSHRSLDPIMCMVDQNVAFLDVCRPYLVMLHDGEPSPFAPREAEEAGEEAGSSQKKEEGQAETVNSVKKDEVKKEIPPTPVDLDDLERRTVLVEGVEPGNYFRLEATRDGCVFLARTERPFLKYQSVTDHTRGKLDLHTYVLKDKKASRSLEGIANYHISADGKKLVYRADQDYGVIDVGKEAKVGDGKVVLDEVKVKISRTEEFFQIFDEAWRLQRDWFYDPNMHGMNWEAIREKYRRFVPDCGNRDDLNYLIGEMIGELNAGHTYVRGGDREPGGERVPVGLLGVDFETATDADYYRIAHVIPGKNWNETERSPLATPDCPVRQGHFLIAIDGEEVRANDNVFRLLENKADQYVTLAYNDRPSPEGAQKHRVKTIRSEADIRYREWVEANRAKVARASNGAVGYLHLPNMMQAGLIEFARDFYPQHHKQALIIDERYNGGGFVGDMIIDRLERRIWAITQPREGKFLRNPERVFHGHLAVLINEDTGSNGEYFAEAIKRRRLATLIGRRTWGGAVGIEPHQDMIDGGSVTPPQFAPYGISGEWLIEGHGVDPDIDVQNMPRDVLNGVDAQLDAAVDLLLRQLIEQPMDLPDAPPYPDKAKPGPRSASDQAGSQSHSGPSNALPRSPGS